ncbi:MAG: heavy metal-binding domain-containing protein [Planctomycetota bacterium]
MIVTTTAEVPDNVISHLIGIVSGNVVQSKHFGRDIAAGLKTIVGGEIRGYSEMMSEARDIAAQRMISAAQDVGADAIVNVRFTTNAISQGMSELLAYGTAVKLIQDEKQIDAPVIEKLM